LFTDLAAGDFAQARTRMAPDITEDQLKRTSDELKPLGQFQSISLRSIETSSVNGQTVYKLGGIATFDQGTASFDVEIVPHPTAGYTIRSYRLEPR
jgi:hypothetical protein